ncbi:GGDEF domain-containing protein [Kineococcus glutinatus]|uniref:GGDEF domain-containing protein n=1 Tax=Kineococcus glutinatus TaxID=1070872 RepID=A0ABP9I1Z7_9ACTN
MDLRLVGHPGDPEAGGSSCGCGRGCGDGCPPWAALGLGLARHPDDALVVRRAVRDRTGEVVDFRCEWANETAERNAGRPLRGATLRESYPTVDPALLSLMRRLLESGGSADTEFALSDDSPEEVLRGRVFSSFLTAVDADRVVCQYRDVTELRRAERALQHQAAHDDLTGLPNRRALREHLDRALARLPRGSRTLLLALGDLDGFKEVNDTLGHHAGDEVLQVVAERLRHAVRPQDLVARYGGDEFCLLCEDVGEQHASALLERVRRTVAQPLRLTGGQRVRVGITVGHVATALPVPADDVLRRADAALYERKGRARA